MPESTAAAGGVLGDLLATEALLAGQLEEARGEARRLIDEATAQAEQTRRRTQRELEDRCRALRVRLEREARDQLAALSQRAGRFTDMTDEEVGRMARQVLHAAIVGRIPSGVARSRS